MFTFTSIAKFLAGGVLTGLVCVALTAETMAQQKASPRQDAGSEREGRRSGHFQ
jgi:hypothetical protein